MKKVIVMALVVILAGCANKISKKQEACENQFIAFADIVSCTKESYKKEKDSRVKLYFLKGDQLVEKLKNGEITELDAKTEWQSLYVRLKSGESDERATDQALQAAEDANNNSEKTRQTNCVKIGNTVQCTTN